MKVKEESEKVGLKLNIQKTNIMASGPITSWQIDGETMEIETDLFWGAPNSLQMVTAAMKLRHFLLGRKAMTNLFIGLPIHRKYSCWSWNSSTLANWCKEPTHWKRPWSWERLKAGGEGDDGGWDGWMASLTWWTWVWVGSGVGNGQGSLVCCSPWGYREWDTPKRLSWTELYDIFIHYSTMDIYVVFRFGYCK